MKAETKLRKQIIKVLQDKKSKVTSWSIDNEIKGQYDEFGMTIYESTGRQSFTINVKASR